MNEDRSPPPASVSIRHMAVFLARIDALGSPHAERIRALLSEGAVLSVERFGKDEWIPVEVNVEWVEAVFRILGEARAGALFRGMTRHDFDESILKTFIAGAMRLFGTDMGVLLRRLPAGFETMFRNTFRASYEATGDRTARVTLDALAPPCIASAPWLESVRRGIWGIFDIRGVSAEIDLIERDYALSRAVFSLSWDFDAPRLR